MQVQITKSSIPTTAIACSPCCCLAWDREVSLTYFFQEFFFFFLRELLEGAWDSRISLSTSAFSDCCAYDNKKRTWDHELEILNVWLFYTFMTLVISFLFILFVAWMIFVYLYTSLSCMLVLWLSVNVCHFQVSLKKQILISIKNTCLNKGHKHLRPVWSWLDTFFKDMLAGDCPPKKYNNISHLSQCPITTSG